MDVPPASLGSVLCGLLPYRKGYRYHQAEAQAQLCPRSGDAPLLAAVGRIEVQSTGSSPCSF